MSTPALLTEILKSAQTASSLSGLSPLYVDSLGVLQKANGVVPVQPCTTCLNADEALPGWMRTNNSTLNLPSNSAGIGGWLLTLYYDSVAKIQVFFAWTPNIFIRRHTSGTSDASWRNWYQASLVAL